MVCELRYACFIFLAALSVSASAEMTPSALEFGMDDTLFVGDSNAGVIYAFDLPEDYRARKEASPYNLLDVDGLVRDELGAEFGSVIYHDLAVHPVSRDAFVSVTFRKKRKERSSVLAIDRDGSVREIDFSKASSTSFSIPDAADASVTFWRDIPAPTLTITDLDFVDGELFVSGISNG